MCQGTLLESDDLEETLESPLCQESQIQQAVDQMSGDCPNKLRHAIIEDTPLDEKKRCLCYLEVSKEYANTLNCRTMPSKVLTLTEEYAICEKEANDYSQERGICKLGTIQPLISGMTVECQNEIYKAIDTDTPLSEERRCSCYLQVEESRALDIHCRSMETKTMTVRQEYMQCQQAELESDSR